MTLRDSVRAVDTCPTCTRLTAPDPDSTAVIAWYTCAACGAEWSARLRDGRPLSAIIFNPSPTREA